MLALFCPKVLVNIAIPVFNGCFYLGTTPWYAQLLFWHIAHLSLVIATVTGWLAQPTELLYGMVKSPLGCDTRDQPTLFLSFFKEKIA